MTNEERFDTLFAGLRRAYGTYRLPNTDELEEGEKHEGRAVTVRADLTIEHWRDHLSGTTSVGVTPIDDDDSVSFGAIDIDVYKGLDVPQLCGLLSDYPVIPCRTKSGGVHIYLFTKEKVPAALMQRKLRELAQTLGYGTSEVFPKQTHVLSNRGDIGSWINMPYFGGDTSNRYALRLDGTKQTMEMFLERAEQRRVSKDELRALKFGKKVAAVEGAVADDRFDQAPPCLQFLAGQGFPEGARNNSMMNIVVYLKLRYPDNEEWKAHLDSYNQLYMVPPLPSREITTIEKSAERKDYSYMCSQPPIAPYCNRDKCLKMKYGVGSGSGATAVLTNARMLNTDPPVYFIDVDGTTVDFQTENLQSQILFQRRLMDVKKFWPEQPRTAWQKILRDLVENTQVIEVPTQNTEHGHFIHFVFEYFRLHVQTQGVDAIVNLRQPYYDEAKSEVHFMLPHLMPYVKKQGMGYIHLSKAVKYLHQAGATYYQYKEDESEASESHLIYMMAHKVTDKTLEVEDEVTKEVF